MVSFESSNATLSLQASAQDSVTEQHTDAMLSPEAQSSQRFGFTPEAERLNGRLAMLGFTSLLAWALYV